MSDNQFTDNVACINEDLVYSQAAQNFVEVSRSIPDTPFLNAIRIAITFELFHATEQLLKGIDEPTRPFRDLLEKHTALLKAATFDDQIYTQQDHQDWNSVEDSTGSHYGNLFSEFDSDSYYKEAYQVLSHRFERNAIDIDNINRKSALDAGCGGGRYTVALKKMGFAKATGLDWSQEGIATAQERLAATDETSVEFKNGSVLEMPFEDESFDFVYSNGVLHHTADLNKGLSELFRVLKTGGDGFLYLIESPGGIHWDVIEILRPLMKPVPYDLARAQFKIMGVPANRRYYILDHIMVPINLRPTQQEVEGWLTESGAKNIRRLNRGTDYDRSEQIYQNAPYAKEKFGIGEHRYVFNK